MIKVNLNFENMEELCEFVDRMDSSKVYVKVTSSVQDKIDTFRSNKSSEMRQKIILKILKEKSKLSTYRIKYNLYNAGILCSLKTVRRDCKKLYERDLVFLEVKESDNVCSGRKYIWGMK